MVIFNFRVPVPGSGEKDSIRKFIRSQRDGTVSGISGLRIMRRSKFTDHITATWVAEQLGKKSDKPFLLACGFYRPHVPFFPPRRVYDSFQDVKLPEVVEDDWDDIPDAARKVSLSNPKIPTHDWMKEKNRWQLAVHAYLASVRWTDEQLGRVLDALDKGPHAKDTIVVLFSDHGYHLGEKQRWSKFSLWERTTTGSLNCKCAEWDQRKHRSAG